VINLRSSQAPGKAHSLNNVCVGVGRRD
jgi:hypothetical protein